MNTKKLLEKVPTAERERKLWWTKEMGSPLFLPLSREEAKAKVGKYEVNWVAAEKAGFNIVRERYFSWLLGHSQSFMDQIRSEIAEELAKKELTHSKVPKHQWEAKMNLLIDKYKKELKDTSFSRLLKVRKGAYIGEVRDRMALFNGRNVKSAILALNEKYLNRIGRVIPHGKEMERVISGFVHPNSNTFNEAGGRQRVLTYQEIESALLEYLCIELEKIPYPEFDAIDDLQIVERQMIDALVKQYSSPELSPLGTQTHVKTINAESVRKLIQLWQSSTSHKERLGAESPETEEGRKQQQNLQEVRGLIEEAFKAGESAVAKVSAQMPRKTSETLKQYGDRLIAAIEKNLKNNTAAKLAYGNELQQVLEKVAKGLKEQVLVEVNVVIRKTPKNPGETDVQYAQRISNNARVRLRSNPEKLDIAEPLLKQFVTEARIRQVRDEVLRKIVVMGKSTEDAVRVRNEMQIVLTELAATLKEEERLDINVMKKAATNALMEGRRRLEARREARKQRIQVLEKILENVKSNLHLSADEQSYLDARKDGSDNTLWSIIQRAYREFIDSDRGLSDYLETEKELSTGNRTEQQIMDELKVYLNRDKAFRAMIGSMGEDALEVSNSFLNKMKAYVNFTEQDTLIVVEESAQPKAGAVGFQEQNLKAREIIKKGVTESNEKALLRVNGMLEKIKQQPGEKRVDWATRAADEVKKKLRESDLHMLALATPMLDSFVVQERILDVREKALSELAVMKRTDKENEEFRNNIRNAFIVLSAELAENERLDIDVMRDVASNAVRVVQGQRKETNERVDALKGVVDGILIQPFVDALSEAERMYGKAQTDEKGNAVLEVIHQAWDKFINTDEKLKKKYIKGIPIEDNRSQVEWMGAFLNYLHQDECFLNIVGLIQRDQSKVAQNFLTKLRTSFNFRQGDLDTGKYLKDNKAVINKATEKRIKEVEFEVYGMFDDVEPTDDETRIDWVIRASKEVKRQLQPDPEKLYIALPFIKERLIDEQIAHVRETVLSEILDDVQIADKDRQQFKKGLEKAFAERSAQLPKEDRVDIDKMREIGKEALLAMQGEAQRSERTKILNEILGRSLKNFELELTEEENTYAGLKRLSPKWNNVFDVIKEAYNKFIYTDKIRKTYIEGRTVPDDDDEIMDDFKVYLNKDQDFRALLEAMAEDKHQAATGFLAKLKTYAAQTWHDAPDSDDEYEEFTNES